MQTKSDMKKKEDEEAVDLTVSAAWMTFQSGTTSHGLPHIINAQGWFKKFLWLFSTMICLFGLGFNYYQLCTKYLSYSVSVSVKLKHSKSVEFPAVTVCNNNPLKRSAIPRNSSLLCMVSQYQQQLRSNCNTTTTLSTPQNDSLSSSFVRFSHSTTQAPVTYNFFSNTTKPSLAERTPEGNEDCLSNSGMMGDDGSMQRSDYMFHNQFLEEISSLPDTQKCEFGHQLPLLLKDCTFAGSNCNFSEFGHFFNNYHGNCYTFNSKMFHSHSQKLKISRKTGPRFGLSLLFNLEQKDYIGELTESAGLRLVVHDPTRMPFPEDEGILVSPNTLTNIGITMVKTGKLDGVYGDCYDEKNPRVSVTTIYKTMYNSTYSEKSCHYTCLDKEIQEKCSCIDIKFPMPEEKYNCTINPCSAKNQTQVDCQAHIWSLYDMDMLPCSDACTVPCAETIYKPIISTERWPSKKHQVTMQEIAPLANVAREIENNHSEDYGMVNVFIQDFTYTSITESPAYEWQDFVSDIGGILGLYIGFSLLTIVEFVELFIDLGRLIVMKTFCTKQSKKAQPDDDAVTEYSDYEVKVDSSTLKDLPKYDELQASTKETF